MCIVEHWVLGIVLDGLKLAWNGIAELLFHQVVDQCLNHGERYLVECAVHPLIIAAAFHVGQLFWSVGLKQEATTTALREEVLIELGIGRNEHHAHILLLGYLVVWLIVVPSRVESKAVSHGITAWVAHRVGPGIVAKRTVGLGVEITLLKHGVNLVAVEQTVACGQGSVVEWSGEAVEHVAEHLCAIVRADHLCHVLRGDEHLVQTVDVTVLTHDVAFHHLAVVNVGIVFITLNAHDHFKVIVGDALVAHLGGKEMGHHRACVVKRHVDAAFLWSPEAFPVVLV